MKEQPSKRVAESAAPERRPSRTDAQAAARSHDASPLRQFQQSFGNRAVGRLIQAKLRVSRPGDAHEQEADRVAELVTAAPAPRPASPPDISRAPQPDLQRACARCEEEEEGKVDRKAAGPSAAAPPQSARQGPGGEGSARAAAALGRLGGGEPLPASVRADFEPRFGYDFRDVRVHADEGAAEAARSVNALAFTTGRDVVFGAGQFAPDTQGGRWLLAHELTHVVQQGQGRATGLQRREPWWGEEEELDPLTGEPMEGGRRPRHGPLPYRQALDSIVPSPRPRPAAANVRDTRPPVLPAEMTMFTDLRTYINGLPARLRALVNTGSASDPWLTSSNPHVLSALGVLDRLVADLSGPSFVVRFDKATGTSTAASYDHLNDNMSLQPFTTPAQRTLIAVDMLHEYAHILQDREAEQVFARQRQPHQATREEDLQREIGARREQVYFGEMIRILRDPVPSSAIFGSQLSDMVFRGKFETERLATRPRARAAATRDIRQSIEQPYAAQLTTNASFKTYAVEIADNNHALLYWDLPRVTSPKDLGEVPATVNSAALLNVFLSRAVQALPEFGKLFDGPGGTRLAAVSFATVYKDEHITEFGLNPP